MADSTKIRGVTIELGADTTGISKGLKDINSEIKSTQSQLKDVEKLLKLDPTNTELLAQKQQLLSKAIEESKQKLNVLHEAEKKLKDNGVDENSEQFMALKREIAATEGQMSQMESQTKKEEKALKDEGKQAEETGKSHEILKGALAAVGTAFTAMAAAAGAAVVALGKSLVQASVDGAAYADSVLSESTKAGIATDKYQELAYAADLVDVSVETITGAMRKNINAMSGAADGSSKYAEAYEKLGISVTDVDGNLRNSEEVFWDVIDALGNIEDYTEREATAMDILGRSSAELEPLIQKGSAGMEELAQAARDAGYVMSGDTLQSYGEFQDELDKLKTGATAAKNAIGTALLPALTKLGRTGVDLLADFTNALNGSDGSVGGMVGAIEQILPEIMDTIEQYVPELLQLVTSVVSQIVISLVRMLPQFVELASGLINELIQGIMQAMPLILGATTALVTALVDGIIDNLPMLLETAGTLLETIATGLITSLPSMIPKMAEVITNLALMLSDENNIEKFIEVAVELIEALVVGLVDAMPILIDAAPKIVIGIVNGIVKAFPKILESGKNIIAKLWEGIKGTFSTMLDWGKKIWEPISNGFSKIWNDVKNIGKNIIEGLWEGIKSAWSWVSEGVSGIFDGLIGGVKKVLGIHSPSKVFASIGEYMAEGLGIGWDKEFNSIEGDILNGMDSLAAPSIVAQGTQQSISVDTSGIVTALNNQQNMTNIQISFEGSLGQLAQLLTPVINTENRRLGTSLG